MKYKYRPNCRIIDYEKMKVKFVFDENGEFQTDDPELIEWIRKNKNFLKGEEAPKETTVLDEGNNARSDLIHCKKCNLYFENRGAFLVHCRSKEHKGGE